MRHDPHSTLGRISRCIATALLPIVNPLLQSSRFLLASHTTASRPRLLPNAGGRASDRDERALSPESHPSHVDSQSDRLPQASVCAELHPSTRRGVRRGRSSAWTTRSHQIGGSNRRDHGIYATGALAQLANLNTGRQPREASEWNRLFLTAFYRIYRR